MDTRDSILVVDDDENILQLVSDALGDSYEIKTASDAVEAADRL